MVSAGRWLLLALGLLATLPTTMADSLDALDLKADLLVADRDAIANPAELATPPWQNQRVPVSPLNIRQTLSGQTGWLTLVLDVPAELAGQTAYLSLSFPVVLADLTVWGPDGQPVTADLVPGIGGLALPVALDAGLQQWTLRLHGNRQLSLRTQVHTPAAHGRNQLLYSLWLFGLAGAGLLAASSLAIIQARRLYRSERRSNDGRWLLWPSYLLVMVLFASSWYLGLWSLVGLNITDNQLHLASVHSVPGLLLGLATGLLILIWWQRSLHNPVYRRAVLLVIPAATALGYALGPWVLQFILLGLCVIRLLGYGVRRHDVHALPVVGATLSLLLWLFVELLQQSPLGIAGPFGLLVPTGLLALHVHFVYQSYFVRRRQAGPSFARDTGLTLNDSQTTVLLRKLNHDLRSPIHGVLGMTNLLSETALNRDQQEYVATTHNAGLQMLNLADEMRALTRIASEQIHVRPKPVDLNAFLHEIVNPFARLASQKSIEVVTEVLSNVPTRVMIDSDLVAQVLRIVLDNSVKFTEEGVIEVAIRREGQRRLRIRVDDTGRGVKEEDVRGLFEFQGLHGSDDQGHSDVRLGLPIAHALVRAMGGLIGISRAAEKGSSVWISLPFEPAPDDEPERTRPELSPLQQQKVLVVDDHLASRKVLEDQTRHWGMQPEMASSGKEALAILQSHMYFHQPFDWVIIDYRMPEMNGLELLEKIRANEGLRALQVIVMTGIDLHYVEQAAEDLGAVAVLAKPVNPRQLMALLQEDMT
ncbi:response regulator [Natronospirillum operosum]|uniref:histidine kinase n=1 Tax=Natronospirillum operosum TaxID=2759953 RepID=A0A4Z0WA07_9GAMM|nr:response regulator [Natronospirillum operosum]TGG94982.1 response regulator [Natronospirillum operosum]